MTTPMRLLLLRVPGDDESWRCAFDLLQGAAVLDMPVEFAVAGEALEWILPASAVAGQNAVSRALSSLALLGIEQVLAPQPWPQDLATRTPALPVRWMDSRSWHDWLRQAPLQVW